MPASERDVHVTELERGERDETIVLADGRVLA
jgi:hypothetical protein